MGAVQVLLCLERPPLPLLPQQEMRDEEKPPIGLILCTDKNEAVVKYTLSGCAERIFSSKYQLHLLIEEELKRELERERDQILSFQEDE